LFQESADILHTKPTASQGDLDMPTLTVLHTFDPFPSVSLPRDGLNPAAGLIIDAQGDLFGTTEFGGSAGQGTVFEIANDPIGGCTSPA